MKWPHLSWGIVIAVVLVIFIALVVAGYWFQWDWTGLPAHNIPDPQKYQPAKTLWDWLNLLGVLAIPVVVGFGAVWYTTRQTKASEAAAEQQRKAESERLLDAQRQATLQAYIDRMSDILLTRSIEDLKKDPGFFTVAKARTLSTLKNLDPDRKTMVFEFLYSATLISFLTLDDADLSGANLSGANLREAKLRRTNLRGANLHGVTLDKAELFSANLSGANVERVTMVDAQLIGVNLTGAKLKDTYLTRANLSEANLTGAEVAEEQLKKAGSLTNTIMPDGTKHP